MGLTRRIITGFFDYLFNSLSFFIADIAFIPYAPDVPAIIIELKKDDSVENAIDQIKNRKYPEALEKYKDDLLLVAISYDSKTKEHFCRLEKA